MKKFLLVIFLSFLSLLSYAQNNNANPSYQKLSDSVYKIEHKYPLPNSIYKKYMEFRNSAQEAYNRKDFNKCIYFFEKASEQALMKDGFLKFIAGVSFYNIAVELKDEKIKLKAKLLLSQANYEGFLDAQTFLKNNF